MKRINPLMKTDYPDPDVIRVDDTYYMVSTTMYFMPGGVILRSYNLVDWEIASYIYDELDNTPGQLLSDTDNMYGKGMWAASLRYHKGTFYVCFVAYDTQKTYLYKSKDICGPWQKQYIEGFFHDSSLLFDDDDRVYIMYGNQDIYLTELNEDITGPKEGGLHRLVIRDTGNVRLGYEGTHFYKINGKYYAFFIHWPNDGNGQRTQTCFVADSLDGTFVGKDVLDDDMGFWNQGVAQGGIVDTPDGDWYAILFQDTGAVGRIPVLIPVKWENDFPVFGENGKVPQVIPVKDLRPGYEYAPLFESDDFRYGEAENNETEEDNSKEYRGQQEQRILKKVWQWNHTPDHKLWSVTEKTGTLTICTDKICQNPVYAKNTLTQRMKYPRCAASVKVNVAGLQDGDYAGFCALQSCYGMIALTKDRGKNYLVMTARTVKEESPLWLEEDYGPGEEFARIPWDKDEVHLRIAADFTDLKDTVEFFYEQDGVWKKLGITHKMYFKLDHFTGYRFALTVYSTKQAGGKAEFQEFVYEA